MAGESRMKRIACQCLLVLCSFALPSCLLLGSPHRIISNLDSESICLGLAYSYTIVVDSAPDPDLSSFDAINLPPGLNIKGLA